MNRPLIFALFVAVAGCSFEPRNLAGRVSCGPAGACPEGLTCWADAGPPGGLCCAPEGCPGPEPQVEAGVPDVPQAPEANAVETATEMPPDLREVGPRVFPLGHECDLSDKVACGATGTCEVNCTAGPSFSRAQCRPNGPNKQVGEACSRSDDCADGATCISLSCGTVRLGVCVAECRSDRDCVADQICRSFGCVGESARFGYCSPACNPLAATSGCPAGLACLFDRIDGLRCGCPPIAPVADGMPCERSDQCLIGSSCVRRQGASVCRPVCRLGGTDCGAGFRCAPLLERRSYGACVPQAEPDPQCDPTGPSRCGTDETCSARCLNPGEVIACEPSDSIAEGGACDSTNDCAHGSGCTLRRCPTGDVGTCRRHCRANADCPKNARCTGFSCPNGGIAYGRCTASCDPRGDGSGGCRPGTVCYLERFDGTDCDCPTPAPTDGQACAAMGRPCAVGLLCAFEDGQRRCRPICRLDEPATCVPDRTCTPVSDNREFGACQP